MGKSSRHQGENKFKFKKFSDRVAEVKIDVLHKIRQPTEDSEDYETYFQAALIKWTSLNHTNDYKTFVAEISGQSRTFVQLVHHEDQIVATLITHLSVPDSMAYEALLDLVVELAKDLQHDFYKHFHNVFNVMINMLKTHPRDVSLLEMIFTCLSYLFKFLWRYMVKDIKTVFNYYSPILDTNNRPYIRKFAAESFGFLIRKVKDPDNVLDLIFESFNHRSQYILGIGRLLFEVMKGVRQHIHSCAETIFPLLLWKIGPHSTSSESSDSTVFTKVKSCISHMMSAMSEHVSGTNHLDPLWLILLSHIKLRQKLWIESGDQHQPVSYLLELLLVWLDFKHGSLVNIPDSVADALYTVLDSKLALPGVLLTNVLNCVSSLLQGCHETISPSSLNQVINLSFNHKFPSNQIYPFAKTISTENIFEECVLPSLIDLIQSRMDDSVSSDKTESLMFVTELISSKTISIFDASHLEQHKCYVMDFLTSTKRSAGSKQRYTFQQYLWDLLSPDNLEDINQLTRLWAALVCIPNIRCSDPDYNVLQHTIDGLWCQVTTSEETSPIKELQLSILHEATLCLHFCGRKQFWNSITFDKIKSLLKCCSNSVRALQIIDLYFFLAQQSQSRKDVTNEATCLTIFPLLEANLSHYSHTIRLLTLQILSQFHLTLPFLEDPSLSQPGVFRICLDAEKTPPTVHDFRETLRHLQYLDAKLVHRNIPVANPRFEQVPLRYLIGNLFISFKPIWEPVHKLIASHAFSMTKDSFWEVYGSHLDKCASVCEGSVPTPTVTTTFEIEDNEEESSIHSDLLQLLMEQDSRPKSDLLKPNMEFFREHLWKNMLLFPQVCEGNSKLLTSLLFRFVKNEYYQVDAETVALQNIMCKEWRQRGDRTRNNCEGGGENGEDGLEEEVVAGEEDEDVKEGSDVDDEEVEEDGGDVEEEAEENSDIDDDDVVKVKDMNGEEESRETDEDGEVKEEEEEEQEEMETLEEKKKKCKRRKVKQEQDENHNSITNNDTTITTTAAATSRKQEPAVLKHLLNHFILFSKFKHGGSLYQSLQLKELYNKFLQHRELRVQKMAFDCLMTFPNKDINPYRENLVHILQNKGFRAELARFNLDSNCCFLKKEHRTSVFQVLSRILCGVLKNKKTPESKKGQVFTFFCGCSLQERITFVEVVLKPCLDFLSNYSSFDHLKNSIDLTRVFPPSLFQSFSNLIWLILRKLGHYLQTYLKNMLHVILGMIATVNACLKNKRKIYQRIVKCLLQASRPCYLRLYQFFTVFETYSYTPEDIDCVFDVVVWPKIQTLPKDCVNGPTFLLKLLNIWSKNPRLFPCFLKKNMIDGVTISPMTFVFQLLCTKRINRTVSLLIVDMVMNFYNPELTEDGLQFELIVVNGSGTHSQDIRELGSEILKPHFGSIVAYLKNYFMAVRKRLGMKKANARELSILSHISADVTDNQLCSDLVRLLLPFLIKKITRTTEMEVDLLNSILNLLTHVEKPPSILFRQMTHLLFTINHEEPKKLLYDVILKLSQKDDNLKDIGEVLCGLNSWNPRKLEEIDYDRRLSAFNAASRLITKMDVLDTDFIVPIIYNCCHFISTIEDFSIRNSSTQCLLNIVNKFTNSTSEKHVYYEIVVKTLVPKVQYGIKNPSQAVCREYFTILQAIVVKFSTMKPFDDLIKLTDNDKDIDFFENMKNIKVQRRSRALRRLAAKLGSYNMSQEALTHYLLPLASTIIQREYKQIEGIQERAIELLGSLCGLISWKVYLQQLQFYVKRMIMPRNNKCQNQKLLVRVVVTILDSFRFDLSNSSYESDQEKGPFGKYIEDNQENTQASQENELDDDDDNDDADGDKNNNVDDNDDDGTPIGIIEELTDANYCEVKDSKGNIMKYLVCPEGMANVIHKTILRNIVPMLYKVLVKRVKSESEHKLAKKSLAEEFEIVRVPVALAIVKLLHVLPRDSLKSFLPKVILRICEFLRSRCLDIRKSARDTLTKIATVIGPGYLPCIIYELRSALSRGYQLHILGFTIHSLLNAIVGQLKASDLNPCCKSLIEIFNEDIFGMVAEEKTVDAITSNFIEAQTCKSVYSYGLLARFISKSHVTKLVAPLKDILDTSSNQKNIKKVENILQKILAGLLLNRDFETKDLLIFIHSLVLQTLPLLVNTKQDKNKKKYETDLKPESCLIIPKAPRRDEKKAKIIKKTNFHVLAEFGLQLLYFTFKKSRLKSTEKDHLELLDPFVGILIDSIESKHLPMVIFSLKSLNIMMKFPLPSIHKNIKHLANHLFSLLSSYGASGAARGKNAELVTVIFKSITILVREIHYYTLQLDQLHVLLTYCEEDIIDYTRQACAFNLIKAILHRKIVSDNIIELISHIEKLAITSDISYIQKQSRDVVLRFILDYPLGKKLYDHLEFIFQQLNYKQETGRQSAIDLLTSIIHKYPIVNLNKDAGLFFIPFCTSLVNDDSSKCRKSVAGTIKLLLQRLSVDTCNELFTNCINWYSNKKLQLRMVAAQVSGLFAETEKIDFKKRLPDFLPLLTKHTRKDALSNTSLTSVEHDQDRLLYNSLNTFLKIVRCCDILQDKTFIKETNSIWGNVQELMLYPHMWVQLVSAQLLGLLFSVWVPQKLASSIFNGEQPTNTQPPYLLIDGQKKIHALVLNSIGQLQTTLLQKQQAEQAVKNLVFLTKVIKHLNLLQGILKVNKAEEECQDREVKAEETLRGVRVKDMTEEEEEESMDIEGDEEEEEEKDEANERRKEMKEKEIEKEEEEKGERGEEEGTVVVAEEDIGEPVEMGGKEGEMDTEEKDEEEDEVEDAEEEDEGPGEYRVSLPWVTRKMIHEAHYENIHNPRCVLKRSYVFKWFAAIAIDLGAELLADVIHIVLPALHRELNNTRRMPDPKLNALTQEVLELLKKTVGTSIFSEKFAQAQKIRMDRISSRKQRKAIEAVTRPDITYKRKMKQNVAKVAAKKRKIAKIQTLKVLKGRFSRK